jgi:hypothetical protein
MHQQEEKMNTDTPLLSHKYLHYDMSGDGGNFGMFIVRVGPYIVGISQGGSDANITLDEALYPPDGSSVPLSIGVYECNDESLTDEEILTALYDMPIHDHLMSECVVRDFLAANDFLTMFKKVVGA